MIRTYEDNNDLGGYFAEKYLELVDLYGHWKCISIEEKVKKTPTKVTVKLKSSKLINTYFKEYIFSPGAMLSYIPVAKFINNSIYGRLMMTT